MREQRLEGVADAIDFAATVESEVVWCEFAVLRQIAGCARRGDAKARHQIRAANLAEEVETEINIGEAFALRLVQRF